MRWIGLAALAALVGACFGRALFLDEQFAFRDSAHFYYPLYKVIQDQWATGHVPLWNPWENAGMPMLGNPTAAVLYPGKLIFAPLPYAWGTRLYTIAHVLLAVGAMWALMRHWAVSWAGSIVSGLSYGFAGPILFQYCNIIFLVGAAWLPLGMLAADRLVRLGRRRAVVELAAVLAMQVLGGDPQTAYLVGLCAIGYALGSMRSDDPPGWLARLRPDIGPAIWIPIGLILWTSATLAAAFWIPGLRPRATATNPMPALPWSTAWPKVLLGFWGVAALAFVLRWKARPAGRRFLHDAAWLLAAAALAGLLAAAQLLPVIEFSGLTVRASREANHEIYAFSLEPYRLLELVWPNLFGFDYNHQTDWLPFLPSSGGHKVWLHSLYMGAPAVVLGLSVFGFRSGPAPRAWLSAILLISVLGAIGTYGSPIAYARGVPALADPARLGPSDEPFVGPIRLDGELRDGDGGFYWMLATFLPGFDTFRYPSKLLTFTAVALAGLAGFGWDQVRAGNGRARRLAQSLAGLSALLLVGTLAARGPIIHHFATSPWASAGGLYGPLEPAATWAAIARSLAHATVALALLAALLRAAMRDSSLPRAEVFLIALVALDLAVANRPLIYTAPQSLFDAETKPRVLQVIEAAEAENPSPGPYRIHRMAAWSPPGWRLQNSNQRGREMVEWERASIQPKYGLLNDVHYTSTQGTAELFDVDYFFGAFHRVLRDEGAARLGAQPGARAVIFPRRGFDLWGSRYFVLPIYNGNWLDEFRSYAAFLPNATSIDPDPATLARMSMEEQEALARDIDFQVLRNEQAMPRAWITRDARFFEPIVGMSKADRAAMMNEILYPNDEFWTNPDLRFYDPRRTVWLEVPAERRAGLRPYLAGGASSGDVIEYVTSEPERTVLKATLGRPGILVLAEVNYPGWKLTVDGQPAEILRANRAMRGVALEAGTHDLSFTYEPASFRIGAALSGLGIVIAIGTLIAPRFARRSLSGVSA